MQFLKTLLIVLAVGIAVAFAFNNWTTVPVRLWGALIADINLPLLMTLCFLAGLIPTWLWHSAVRWRLRQRLTSSERTIFDLRQAAAVPTPVVAVEPDPLPTGITQPTIDEPRP